MEYINQVEIQGRVGSVHTAEFSGRKITTMSVMTNTTENTIDGNRVIETDWHTVKLIDFPIPIEKGAAVRVVGRLKNRRYTGTDGVERISVEIIAFGCELINVK